jgi:hypothetical protein
MSHPTSTLVAANESTWRVDKFIVPQQAIPAFMARVHRIDRDLATMPGCRQNLVLTQTGGPGEFNVVTVVEWASAHAMAEAKATMQARYAEEGFQPEAFMREIGVKADLALYSQSV